MWCGLHGNDNELITVYDNGKVLSIKPIGISGAEYKISTHT